MPEWIRHPWPWYVAGPLIGLIVPTLLLIGNKHFGISANLRHACAACFPARIPFFQYEWKKEIWNFFFVGGIFVGAFLAVWLLANPDPVAVHPALTKELAGYGITDHSKLLPPEIFSFSSLFTLRGLVLLVGGGFLVGFGTRYAGGCTSGHSIMGLSNLQLPSLIATISFMAGGFIMANWILPFILSL
ncbi:YeeE/YedE family protein [Flaviaesturariibacter aridisoli]|uniref:YeeE/YedE family protein n=1 Tax=Flaviaesturariibacter aridisoli TaxID=2545761 RepID=A0A4R4E1H3_9BACT|nr:YeeE/YedE thiosulfate transporter family protein [Flaviaesturariibacter aridisoli]TCZ73334.1 YeeE/YedE family protein [Flaviaesturariibacter aridisoli]